MPTFFSRLQRGITPMSPGGREKKTWMDDFDGAPTEMLGGKRRRLETPLPKLSGGVGPNEKRIPVSSRPLQPSSPFPQGVVRSRQDYASYLAATTHLNSSCSSFSPANALTLALPTPAVSVTAMLTAPHISAQTARNGSTPAAVDSPVDHNIPTGSGAALPVPQSELPPHHHPPPQPILPLNPPPFHEPAATSFRSISTASLTPTQNSYKSSTKTTSSLHAYKKQNSPPHPLKQVSCSGW